MVSEKILEVDPTICLWELLIPGCVTSLIISPWELLIQFGPEGLDWQDLG